MEEVIKSNSKFGGYTSIKAAEVHSKFKLGSKRISDSQTRQGRKSFKMLRELIWNLLLVVAVTGLTAACKGYQARIVKLENCAGPDAVVTLDPDFTVELNNNCELIPRGCVVNKAFGTAVSKYKVQKDGVVLKQGQLDLCEVAGQASGELKDMLKLFGAPSSCPVSEGRICSNDQKVDLSKYRAMLSLARGNIVLESEVEHDVGKSCFNIELEIARA